MSALGRVSRWAANLEACRRSGLLGAHRNAADAASPNARPGGCPVRELHDDIGDPPPCRRAIVSAAHGELAAAMLRGGFTSEEASTIAGSNYMRSFGPRSDKRYARTRSSRSWGEVAGTPALAGPSMPLHTAVWHIIASDRARRPPSAKGFKGY
jgi:hypothetical protein